MLAKCIVLSNIISVVSDNILRIYIQEPLLILKKIHIFFLLYQHIAAYSSTARFPCLIPGNVCVQDEAMAKPMYTQHHVERYLQKKETCHIKFSAPTTSRKLH